MNQLLCRANGSSHSYTVAIDSKPPMNFMTDVGSTKEAADDPWKSGLLGWVISDSERIYCFAE